MRVLLLSGLGPSFRNSAYLTGSFFDGSDGPNNARDYLRGTPLSDFDLRQLAFRHRGETYPLLRPRRHEYPHLTTFTLLSILERAAVDVVHLDAAALWAGTAVAPSGPIDAVLLSTSYIWNQRLLSLALSWVQEQFPGVFLILGGQYSNLKYAEIMNRYPQVHTIVRGDAEVALPRLLRAGRRNTSYPLIPNLVYRTDKSHWTQTSTGYIDIDTMPRPALRGTFPVVPYESMRGCPFTCKFCSFPFASPKWRYKSAKKIVSDWQGYAETNGTVFVKSMDSTFTIPPSRLRALLRLLPDVDIEWEGYSRANVLDSPELIDAFVAAHCRFLSIGFESMSDHTLGLMNKRVSRAQNLRAFRLLRGGDLGYRASFMVGYPGETPEDFALTHTFLEEDWHGHYMLSVFSISDETMPVWEDKQRLELVVHDPEDPDYSWSHIGMDVHEARRLNHATLDAVRRNNEHAVLLLWQAAYQQWLVPALSTADNLKIEKAVARIGMAPRDHADPRAGSAAVQLQLDGLRAMGVFLAPPHQLSREPLWEAR